jgi:molecular chaperone GrpE
MNGKMTEYEPKPQNDNELPPENQETAQSAPDPAAPNPVAELAALKDQLLRAVAESENQRRRAQRERDEAVKYAAAGLARDLLTVSDNLGRALDAVPAGGGDAMTETLRAGVELVQRELAAAFEKHGIRRLEPLGERFDPNLHQAMFEVPGSEYPSGTVAQVIQPGYVMGERLLRPALVGVAKGPSGAETSAPEAAG